MKEEICVCCGAIIPEGRQICPNCELAGDYSQCAARYETAVKRIAGEVRDDAAGADQGKPKPPRPV